MPDFETLPNGLRVAVEPMPSVASLAVSWLIPVGDAGDHASRLGEAAMLSELLPRGAGDLDSRGFSDALDRLGVQRSVRNGSRSMHVSATMLGDRLEHALPLIVDLVRRPRLPADALEPVRRLCLQSLESLEDEPQRLAMIHLAARHRPPPFDRSGYGTEAGLDAIEIEHLRQRWAREAVPDGSILAVAGRVETAPLLDRLSALLGDWEGTARDVEIAGDPERGVLHVDRDTSQVHLGVALAAPPRRDPEAMDWAIASRILGGGASSRLFVELRERRGLCYSVGASASLGRDRGMLTIYAGSTPDRIGESHRLVLEGLAGMATGIEEIEFRRAAAAFRRGLLAQSERTASRASQLATDVDCLGRPRSLDEIAAEAAAVDLDRLRAFTEARFSSEWVARRSEVHLGPASPDVGASAGDSSRPSAAAETHEGP
jgi:predicted Zn-dependent peptidase